MIGREPRDGRTFETKGEDPILAGKITAANIRGVQDQHIVGGIKHFAPNDQETGRALANAFSFGYSAPIDASVLTVTSLCSSEHLHPKKRRSQRVALFRCLQNWEEMLP